MRLHRLELDNVKGVEHQVVGFADEAVTVISGANEAGKSTLVEAFSMLMKTRHTSAKKEVKALRPKTRDAAPRVAAEFTIGAHRVKVVKEFSGDASAKMTLAYLSGPNAGGSFTGGDAENHLDALRDQTDQALWSALNDTAADPFQQAPLTSSNALTAALQKAAGLNDNADSSIVSLAKRERDNYFTAQRGKPTGEYARLINDFASASTELDTARQKVSDIEQTENDLSEAQVLANQLAQELRIAKIHLNQAEKDQAEAAQARQQAKEAAAQVSQASIAQKLCQNNFDTRASLIAGADNARAKVSEIAAKTSLLNEQLAPIKAALEKANAEVETAKQGQQECEENWNQALAASQFLRVKDELGKAEIRLKEHAADRDRLAKIEAILESQPINSSDGKRLVDEITKASIEVKAAEAALSAASTKLRVDRLGETSELIVDAQKVQIADSQEIDISGNTTIVIPESWRFNFIAPKSSQYRKDVAATRCRYEKALTSAGVKSLEEARQRLDEVNRAGYDAQAIRQRLASVNLTELESRVQSLRTQMGDLAAKRQPTGSLTEAIQAEEDAKTRLESSRQTHKMAVETYQNLDNQRQLIEGELNKLLGGQEGAYAQADSLNKQLAAEREKVGDKALADKLDQANRHLATTQDAKDAADKRLADLDADKRQERFNICTQDVANTRRRLQEARERVSRLEGRLDTASSESCQQRLDDAETKYQSLSLTQKRMNIKAEAAKLLYETLAANLASSQKAYRRPFTAAINRLGADIYHDPDFAVRLADDLTITARTLDGVEIAYEQLSAGAKEQLLILVKLAAASLVDRDEGVPVFLDDELGHTDPERARQMASELSNAGAHAQLIVLTADETRYAELKNRKDIRIG